MSSPTFDNIIFKVTTFETSYTNNSQRVIIFYTLEGKSTTNRNKYENFDNIRFHALASDYSQTCESKFKHFAVCNVRWEDRPPRVRRIHLLS